MRLCALVCLLFSCSALSPALCPMLALSLTQFLLSLRLAGHSHLVPAFCSRFTQTGVPFWCSPSNMSWGARPNPDCSLIILMCFLPGCLDPCPFLSSLSLITFDLLHGLPHISMFRSCPTTEHKYKAIWKLCNGPSSNSCYGEPLSSCQCPWWSLPRLSCWNELARTGILGIISDQSYIVYATRLREGLYQSQSWWQNWNYNCSAWPCIDLEDGGTWEDDLQVLCNLLACPHCKWHWESLVFNLFSLD